MSTEKASAGAITLNRDDELHFISVEGLDDLLEELAEAVSAIAVLRVTEAQLPDLLAQARARADAACAALGLPSGSAEEYGLPLAAQPDAPASAAVDEPPPAREPENDPAGEAPTADETAGDHDPGDDPAGVSAPAGEAAGGVGLTAADDPSGAPTAAAPEGEGPDSTPALPPAEADGHPAVAGGVPVGVTIEQAEENARARAEGQTQSLGAPAAPAVDVGRPLGAASAAILRALDTFDPHPGTLEDLVTHTGYPREQVRARLRALVLNDRVAIAEGYAEPHYTLNVERSELEQLLRRSAGVDE